MIGDRRKVCTKPKGRHKWDISSRDWSRSWYELKKRDRDGQNLVPNQLPIIPTDLEGAMQETQLLFLFCRMPKLWVWGFVPWPKQARWPAPASFPLCTPRAWRSTVDPFLAWRIKAKEVQEKTNVSHQGPLIAELHKEAKQSKHTTQWLGVLASSWFPAPSTIV